MKRNLEKIFQKASQAEIKEKSDRVHALMSQQGFDVVIIGRADNFAWFTCGGNNLVVKTWEAGFGLLCIDKRGIKLIAQTMDGPRMIDEELAGLSVDYVPLRWYEHSREQKAAELYKGKKILSDIPIRGAKCSPATLYEIHYPLTEKELERTRWLARCSEKVIRKVADGLKPGMTEIQVANNLQSEYALEAIDCDVLLVGGDVRIPKYRHPNPSDTPIKKFALLHPAARKWGLHANITRHVSFGRPTADLIKRYKAACTVQATAISLCDVGNKFSDILQAEKDKYAELEFADEWKNHFQGGITGYLLADPTLCKDPQKKVKPNMAYDWFITITGVKSEELSINSSTGIETPSVAGNWPSAPYHVNDKIISLPEILVK